MISHKVSRLFYIRINVGIRSSFYPRVVTFLISRNNKWRMRAHVIAVERRILIMWFNVLCCILRETSLLNFNLFLSDNKRAARVRNLCLKLSFASKCNYIIIWLLINFNYISIFYIQKSFVTYKFIEIIRKFYLTK